MENVHLKNTTERNIAATAAIAIVFQIAMFVLQIITDKIPFNIKCDACHGTDVLGTDPSASGREN